MIYLDNNATTRLSLEVQEKMVEVLTLRLANPSSQHQMGRMARHLLDSALDSLAKSLGLCSGSASEDQLLLTSGGTEANNLAIFGLPQRPGCVIVSAIEHPSLLSAAEQWQSRGREVRLLPVDQNGIVDLNRLEEWIAAHRSHPEDAKQRIELVSLMVANNETGILQPIHEVVRLCREANIRVHTDAVQAIGKVPLSFRDLQVDAMTIAAHKIHGPVGIGCLVLRHGVTIHPQLWGGFQQYGLRPGTEPVALAVGFAKAAELATNLQSERSRTMQALRNRFETKLLECSPIVKILGADVERIPNTSSVVFEGKDRQSLQMAFDLGGLACSTGSACASGSSQPSHVLMAMGLPEKWVQGGLRFSNSFETTEEEVDVAIEVIREVLRTKSPGTLKR